MNIKPTPHRFNPPVALSGSAGLLALVMAAIEMNDAAHPWRAIGLFVIAAAAMGGAAMVATRS